MFFSTLAASDCSVWWLWLGEPFAHPFNLWLESPLCGGIRNCLQCLSVLQRKCIFYLLGNYFPTGVMETPSENLGMLFGCLFPISADGFHSL